MSYLPYTVLFLSKVLNLRTPYAAVTLSSRDHTSVGDFMVSSQAPDRVRCLQAMSLFWEYSVSPNKAPQDSGCPAQR